MRPHPLPSVLVRGAHGWRFDLVDGYAAPFLETCQGFAPV